jgi:ubiquinone/menaquinone biosynthesis C-methylase UbiE
MENREKYIPAFGLHSLTVFYDPLLKLLMPESKFKRRLIDQAKIQRNDRILDLGCGTGTLMILIKQLYPDTVVFGLDGDEKVLQIAERKASKAGVRLNLNQGMSFQLPYPKHFF